LLNDGARSSLPQYRQINFSPSGFARDDCGGRPAAFLVFGAGAPFGLAARSFSWRKLTPRWRSILPQSVQFRCSSRFSFSGRDFGVPAVSTHCSDAARWEADSALFVAERRANVLPLNPPTHQSARFRSHGVGHREIARREDSRNLADLRLRRLSLGPHATANRAHPRGFRSIL
jgi:hypothetical protein